MKLAKLIVTCLALCLTRHVSLATDTNIIAWPANYLANVPDLQTNSIVVTGGDTFGITLLADRTVQTWGFFVLGGSIAPPADATNVIGIAAGSSHAVAVRNDGTVALWGTVLGNHSSQVPPDATNVIAVGVGPGAQHVLALKADGSVLDWGLLSTTNIPPDAVNIVSVAAGSKHSVALRSDGKVIAWGENFFGELNIPTSATNVVAIATTWRGNIALRADGKLVTWGSNPAIPNQSTLTNVIEVAGSGVFGNSGGGMALKNDGTVVAVGTPASATNIMAIGGSGETFMAVKAVGPPIFPLPAVRRVVAAGQTAYLRLPAVGAPPMSYQWSFQGTNVLGATNAVLAITNALPGNAGFYSPVASNALGAVTNSNMQLVVVPVVITNQPSTQSVNLGGTATLRVGVIGQSPTYQWSFNGTNVDGATNSTLTLTNVQLDQAGLYSVVVSNGFGPVSSVSANLVVLPLFITAQPQSQTVVKWMPVTLSVTAGGVPAIQYQWQLNGTNVPGATNSTYTIASMHPTNAGVYSVAITNDYLGLLSSNAIVGITSLAAWGDNSCGPLTVPPSATNVIGVAAGSYDSMALKDDGTVLVWGCNDQGQANVPSEATNAVLVVGGYLSCSALRADGSAIGWGLNSSGEANVPTSFTNGVQIGGIISHRLGLRSDGTAVGWGYDAYGVADVPPGLSNLVAVAAGYNHSAVLRADGTVVAWGLADDNRTNVPPDLTNAVAIAAGNNHTLALRSDGTVTAWGDNASGQTNVPAGLSNVIGIAGGWNHSLALKADGTVVAWGANNLGQTNIPPNLTNVVAIGAGNDFNLVLVGDGPPVVNNIPVHPLWSKGVFSISLDSQPNRVYLLEHKDNLSDLAWVAHPLVAGTGSTVVFTDPTALSAQRFYRIRRW